MHLKYINKLALFVFIFETIIYWEDIMISLIIPVFNTEEKDIRRCIDSVLSQTYKNYEILLVDDGSKLETSSFLDEIATWDILF